MAPIKKNISIFNKWLTHHLNNIRRQDTQHNDTEHNDIQHNDTQHNGFICDTQYNAFMLSVVAPNILVRRINVMGTK
jgi:hypothetical protein